MDTSPSDTNPADIDQEGRLIAHRLILQALMREMAAQSGDPDRFWARLEELFQVQDQDEDPGIVTSDAYGIEATAALEVRRLVEGARKAWMPD